MKDGILLHEFELAGHEFRAYWSPSRKVWLLVNSRGQFSFEGPDSLGLGRVKATLKKLMVRQYQYLLQNADRVIARINGVEGYLDTFRFSERKAWARQAVLA